MGAFPIFILNTPRELPVELRFLLIDPCGLFHGRLPVVIVVSFQICPASLVRRK